MSTRRGMNVVRLALLVLLFVPFNAPAADELQDFEGSKGLWVRSKTIECFIALQPRFRVMAVRCPGEASLLSPGQSSECGLRLAFMEPDQIPASFTVGNQPAEIIEQTPAFLRVRLNPADGLRYFVTVTPDTEHARLVLDLRLENLGPTDRRIACWTVASFPRQGSLVVPFGVQPREARKLVVPWWTRLPQSCLKFGRTALTADVLASVEGKACKIGFNTSSGWIAFASRDRALVSFAAYDPEPVYPESNANIALFLSSSPQVDRCEAEHMGPLKNVAPATCITFTQTIDLINIPTEAADPDIRRQQIEQALNPSPASIQPKMP